jgi:SAM-dependent methyltransferase
VSGNDRRGQATAFGQVADAYERGRPSYPDEAVQWLVGDAPRDVVDLGAGTGKLTRSVVANGHRVTAVEPLPEMLAQLRAALPGVTALVGTAESIPLPDAVADVVVCAQAFHWFDHAVALPEIARVLKPGGWLSLVWNMKDDREPWVVELNKAVDRREAVADGDLHDPIDASGLFDPVEQTTFSFSQMLDRNTLLDVVRSFSYCAVLAEPRRTAVLEQVGLLYDRHAGPSGIELPYVTECYRARVRL